MSYFRKFLVLCLIFIFCQLPVFVDEYSKHLEGHVSEAKYSVEQLQNAARCSHKTLNEYIEKFEKNGDSDIASHGKIMRETQHRYEFLQKAFRAMRETNIFLRPLVFTWYMDREIMVETYQSFSLGFLFTKEIIAWGIFGWLLGVFFLRVKSS